MSEGRRVLTASGKSTEDQGSLAQRKWLAAMWLLWISPQRNYLRPVPRLEFRSFEAVEHQICGITETNGALMS